MGYRANFNGFFVEPQLGYSILNANFMVGTMGYMTDSGRIGYVGGGVGYVFNKKFEVGARYQSASNEGTHWIIWPETGIQFFIECVRRENDRFTYSSPSANISL
jgi:hypothetical protein